MWILLHKLRRARNNHFLFYFHNSKLHFILRSHLTAFRFLCYCRLPQLIQNCWEHSRRFLSFTFSSTLVTSEFAVVPSYRVLNSVAQVIAEAQIWDPTVTHTVSLLPSVPPQGFPSPSWRCCDGVGQGSLLPSEPELHLLWTLRICPSSPLRHINDI